MNEITLVELRPGLTQAMDRVVSGESITVTRYGKPIGVIVPVPILEALWKSARKAEDHGPHAVTDGHAGASDA